MIWLPPAVNLEVQAFSPRAGRTASNVMSSPDSVRMPGVNVPGVDAPGRSLELLVRLARELAADADASMPELVHSALGLFGTLPGVRGASLWLGEGASLHAVGSTGMPLILEQVGRTVAAGGTLLEGETTLSAIPLRWGVGQLGALVIVSDARPGDEQMILLGAGADMLAPVIAHSRRRQGLEVELAQRVRQVNDERRFTERIIDSLPVGLYVIDRDYRIEVWNRKRETGLQGVSREEAVGRTIFEILHRQPADMLRQEFEEAFRTGTVQNFSMESNSTGELRYYRITKIPMRAEDGEVTHVITLGEDVTEWREAQERFAQAEKLAAIGQLAAGVMHEINNPLATIAACAEGLTMVLGGHGGEEGEVTPRQAAEYLRIVEGEVQRSKRIVDRLLEFSRPKPLTPEPVDINAVVEQTLFLLKHHSRFKRYTVNVELDHTAPVTRGNTEQLVQVLMALLVNAMDSMGEDGVIDVNTVAAGPGGDMATIEVRDRGHGIPRQQLAKIFEPFYTTKAPGSGTGLGLSICYGIVTEHGGHIEVESEIEGGSVFRVRLPANYGSTPGLGEARAW